MPTTHTGQVTARWCAACRAALQAAVQPGQHHNVRHVTFVNVRPVASLRPKVMTARLLMGEVRMIQDRSDCQKCCEWLSNASCAGQAQPCAPHPKGLTCPEQGGNGVSKVHAVHCSSRQTQHAGFHAETTELFPQGPVEPMQTPAASSWCLVASLEMPAGGAAVPSTAG